MKIISFTDIEKLQISPQTCYDWIVSMLKSKHTALLPAKTSLKPDLPGVFYNTMPSILPESDAAGVKLVTRYPERSPSLDSQILLYRLSTGENLALLDGNWITAWRTGAVAAHSIQLLALPDFSTIGMIGLGNTARATLKVLLALYPDRDFQIKLKTYKNQHELFAQDFAAYPNLTFTYADTYPDVIKNSDIVISAATVFGDDICPDEYFKPGVLVVPIHTRGFTNCDLFFDKVYADDINHVKGFKYFNQYRFFAEIAEVLRSEKPGRESASERILAYNIGISLHDLYFANQIYNLAKASAPDIFLNPPTAKFWA